MEGSEATNHLLNASQKMESEAQSRKHGVEDGSGHLENRGAKRAKPLFSSSNLPNVTAEEPKPLASSRLTDTSIQSTMPTKKTEVGDNVMRTLEENRHILHSQQQQQAMNQARLAAIRLSDAENKNREGAPKDNATIHILHSSQQQRAMHEARLAAIRLSDAENKNREGAPKDNATIHILHSSQQQRAMHEARLAAIRLSDAENKNREGATQNNAMIPIVIPAASSGHAQIPEAQIRQLQPRSTKFSPPSTPTGLLPSPNVDANNISSSSNTARVEAAVDFQEDAPILLLQFLKESQRAGSLWLAQLPQWRENLENLESSLPEDEEDVRTKNHQIEEKEVEMRTVEAKYEDLLQRVPEGQRNELERVRVKSRKAMQQSLTKLQKVKDDSLSRLEEKRALIENSRAAVRGLEEVAPEVIQVLNELGRRGEIRDL